ncbi:MAG: ATP-binding protein [Thermoanaerobacterales bacterium]|nr:ATP-binding protein [Thermoanaerobacterales bacterium]
MINQTLDKLNSMRLRAMEQEYQRQVELPVNAALPFDDRFGMIVDAEWLAKVNNRLKRFLREANLREPSANLEDINYTPSRNLDKTTIARLSDCRWINEGRNLIITGATGTGKTYLVSAFGNAACRKSLRVRSYRVNRLLTDLAIGRGDGSYNKLLKDLKKPDLLILDDFGMAPIESGACRDLWKLLMTAMAENPSQSLPNYLWQNGMMYLKMLQLLMPYWTEWLIMLTESSLKVQV